MKERGGKWVGANFTKRYVKDQFLPAAGPY